MKQYDEIGRQVSSMQEGWVGMAGLSMMTCDGIPTRYGLDGWGSLVKIGKTYVCARIVVVPILCMYIHSMQVYVYVYVCVNCREYVVCGMYGMYR